MEEGLLNIVGIGGLVAVGAIITFKFLFEFVKYVQKQKREDSV